ncbi:MAG: T9SS type A sorting domain-containing protein [Bacteroidia bacterium]|jgi:hypothetical protein
MKKVLFFLVLTYLVNNMQAQSYHPVATFSYSSEGLYAKVIKAHPSNPNIIYAGAQHVNLSYKGFFDTYDITLIDSVKRLKRMGIQTDSFGVTDFVFRGSDIYAIGSKGIQIINASTPANPVWTRKINTFKDGIATKNIGYMTASLLIEGSKLHYSGSNYYLIDLSDLNNLTKIAEKSYSGINSGSVQRLSADKIIASDGYNVNIMDVSAAPTVTKTTLTALFGDPDQMLYDAPNKILYTASSTSSQAFVYSVNMNNNAQLDSFNYLQVPGFDPSGHSGLFLYKDTLYVGTSLGVALFDVTNPSNLRFLGKLSTGGTSAVFVNDDYLIANDNYNLRFYGRGPGAVIGVDESIKLSTMELFPNPAQQSVCLLLSTAAAVQLELFDQLGKSVQTWGIKSAASKHEVSLHDIKPGIYFMQIVAGDLATTRKLVVE